jgi:hypothetical protein
MSYLVANRTLCLREPERLLLQDLVNVSLLYADMLSTFNSRKPPRQNLVDIEHQLTRIEKALDGIDGINEPRSTRWFLRLIVLCKEVVALIEGREESGPQRAAWQIESDIFTICRDLTRI